VTETGVSGAASQPTYAQEDGGTAVTGSGSVGTLLERAPRPLPGTYEVPLPGSDWGRTESVWPRVIGGIGRTLIAAGTLILLFVVYQLWGTGIREAQAQSRLRGEFATVIEESEVSLPAEDEDLPESLPASAVEPADAVGGTGPEGIAEGELGTTDIVDTSDLVWNPEPADFGPPPPPPDDGDAVARIRIPRIGVDKVVVEGVTPSALKNGPGHYPETPLPGQPGNSAIACHRTTYGSPCFHLDRMEENDLIYVTTQQGAFQYRVTETLIVAPGDLYVLDPTDDNRLTLTTCHPRWSASQRLIVIAELIGESAPNQPADAGPVAPGGAPVDELPGDVEDEGAAPPADDVTPPADQEAAPPDAGLSGDREATLPAILWGLVAALVWLGFWVLGRAWRRWPAYLIGLPVFLVALFFFFENFSLLLPANI
jgi:sortase A